MMHGTFIGLVGHFFPLTTAIVILSQGVNAPDTEYQQEQREWVGDEYFKHQELAGEQKANE